MFWGGCIMHQAVLGRHTNVISGVSCLRCVHPTRILSAAVYTALISKHNPCAFQQEALLNALILSFHFIIYCVINHEHSIFKVSCFKFMLLYKIETQDNDK